jgi:hypothetical protein
MMIVFFAISFIVDFHDAIRIREDFVRMIYEGIVVWELRWSESPSLGEYLTEELILDRGDTSPMISILIFCWLCLYLKSSRTLTRFIRGYSRGAFE